MEDIIEELLGILAPPQVETDANTRFLSQIIRNAVQQQQQPKGASQPPPHAHPKGPPPSPQNKPTTAAQHKQTPYVYTDIREMESYIAVFVDLPGVDKDKINLSITDNVLLLSVDRTLYSNSSDSFCLQERYNGIIKRQIVLPRNINKSTKTATYKDGVLCVKFNKVSECDNAERIDIS